MSDKQVRTRFAPSPTGYLHVGGVRTALFAWLVAKAAGGEFLLRLEDTDRTRHVEESEQHIIDSLSWLGIESDEKIVRQSQRLDIYKKWAEKLVKAGRAYVDSTSEDQLEALREKAKAAKKPFLYRENWPKNSPVWDGNQPLRLKSSPKPYKWHDEVMGDLSAGPETIDDFILIKSDGYPTYNFAHIVDDYEMKISHVIRSQEFLSSVPKFLNLYEALEIERPLLATLPYVMNPDGNKKLSKRDGAKDILDYKREGFLPEALINFLATLGWNDGTEQEIFSVDELTKKFDLSRVHHGGARFDEQRLLWMNGHYIRQMSLESLAKRAEGFWPKEASRARKDYKEAVLGLVQDRLKYFSELPQLTSFFFEEPKMTVKQWVERDPKNQKSRSLLIKDNPEWLEAIVGKLGASSFDEADLGSRLNGLLDELDTSPPILFRMISIALTGSKQYPPLPGMLTVLGKKESLERLKKAADNI